MAMQILLRKFLCVCVCLMVTPSMVLARECKDDYRVYSFDWKDGSRTEYSERHATEHFNLTHMKFENWRGNILVWSVEGDIFCSDVIPTCNLTLKAKDNKKNTDAFSICAGDVSDGKTTKFRMPITEITENDQILYVAFGDLLAFSMACAKYMDARILRKDLFSKELAEVFGGEPPLMLPPYVRFDHCNDDKH